MRVERRSAALAGRQVFFVTVIVHVILIVAVRVRVRLRLRARFGRSASVQAGRVSKDSSG